MEAGCGSGPDEGGGPARAGAASPPVGTDVDGVLGREAVSGLGAEGVQAAPGDDLARLLGYQEQVRRLELLHPLPLCWQRARVEGECRRGVQDLVVVDVQDGGEVLRFGRPDG